MDKIKTEESSNDHQQAMNKKNPNKDAVPCTEDFDRHVDADQLDPPAVPSKNPPDSSDRGAVSRRPTKRSDSSIALMLNERMNAQEYKNWMKLAIALDILHDIVEPIAKKTLKNFQKNLKAKHGVCCEPDCKLGKQPKMCGVCSLWMEDILEQHFNPGEDFSSNIDPKKWPEDKWEVAKIYMPKGHKDGEIDLSSILNLMYKCKQFHPNAVKMPSWVKKAIEARNELAHSKMKVSDVNLQKNVDKVLNMLERLQIDDQDNTKEFVEKLKTLDFEIIVSELQSSSSTLIQNIKLQDLERKCLSEQFKELDDDQLPIQDKEHHARNFRDFLRNNPDLKEYFEDQFKKIEILLEDLSKTKPYNLKSQSISGGLVNMVFANTCNINAPESQSISGRLVNVVCANTCNINAPGSGFASGNEARTADTTEAQSISGECGS